MVSVANAEIITEPETSLHASQPSRHGKEEEAKLVGDRAAEAVKGPKSLFPNDSKRKSTDTLDPPRYLRGFTWSDSHPNISPSALYTETAPPLPSPPQHIVEDPLIQAALHANRDSIKVETPFNVDRLERMLVDHPNQPLVQSVLKGFREGFWPLDDGEWGVEIEEITDNYSSEPADLDAIRAFRDRELKAERWSPALDSTELPLGTKMSPMFVIWQNEKPRIITDHSGSGSGLNDGIRREEAKVRYDDMRSFGQCLHDARLSNPGVPPVLFKDDVATAFLNLPAHPIWQLRQVVMVDGRLYIVRRLVFGNRASPRIWCAVSGLLCWLAIRKLNIVGLHVYMDDFFGWARADDLILFRGQLRPRPQVLLLIFWEAIRCPFEDKKQEHGSPLKIIGFWVDINLGTISLSPSSVIDIQLKINDFLVTPSRQPILRDWLRLAGHLNWLLNVLPWGRPALTELYRKISGKTQLSRGVHINAEVKRDLMWLSEVIPAAIGVHFIDNGRWAEADADLVIWTDASLHGALSFVIAGHGFVYQLRECPPNIKIDIFFLELMAILSAVHHFSQSLQPPRRILLWTDSLDAVGAFNSLRVSESLHNGPLLAVASIFLRSGIDLRVRHIEGKRNTRADMLSRMLLDEFKRNFPSHRVHLFAPPRELLPARWRECF
jgi:hypothetical protein